MNKNQIHITDDLIVAFLNGETTNDQSLAIQSWMNKSSENEKHVEDIRTIWIEAGKLDPKPIVVNVDKAWDSLFTRIENAEEKTKVSKTVPLYKTLLRIAAVLIPTIFISYFYFHSNNESKQLAIVSSNNTITKKLDDSSEVTINAHSKLQFPEKFEDSKREVSLQGEAFFSVTPNKAKPFIIHSGDVVIKVVGTSFNVKTSNESVEVFVQTGKVLLYSILKSTGDTVSLILIPGNKGIYNRKTNTIAKEEQLNTNDLFWMTKSIEFNKTELSEVIAVLKKNYLVSIGIKDEKLSKLRLSASFKNQSIESIIEIIATSLNVEISKTKTSFEIHEKTN